jgi:hypothetical protein
VLSAIEDAEYHFVHTGFDERRVYCPQLIRAFNGQYYRSQLPPEFARATQYELFGHWLYEGVFDGLAPNESTDAALDTRFHVFNPGRVGSYAVVQALQDAGQTNIVHAHSNFEFSRSYRGTCLTYEQLLMVKALDTRRPPVTIICGVRDPFEWAVSAVLRSVEHAAIPRPATPLEAIWHIRRNVGRLLHWFRHAFFQDLDVYGTAFDPERGYATIDKGRTRVLLYRADKLTSLSSALGDQLRLPRFHVQRVNESSARDVFEDLAQQLPPDLCEAVITSPYAAHFFTERERRDMEARWLGSVSTGPPIHDSRQRDEFV